VHGVYAAGAGTFYHELIRSAGGKNAFPDPLPQYPRLSLEGLIMLAPDIIVDIAPAMDGYSCSTLVTDWKTASMIPAVRNGRIHCLTADYATVPGPRILLLADDLRRIIGDRESRHAVP
jgi:iron complex transport system substrate-binding protein